MRVITVNVNGIRAAARKGFFDWLAAERADIVCIQETKAQEHQLADHQTYYPQGYHCRYHDATSRKGYSGVALYSMREPDEVIAGLGFTEFDPEGRCIEARFGDLSVLSLYLPSGTSGAERQAAKMRFLDAFLPRLRALCADGRHYLICGDWNIAHQKIDLANWRGNQKNSGFLPEERAWLDQLFDQVGFVDAFRLVNPGPDQYTWWSNRGQAWAKNVGWRIDYQIATPELARLVRSASIYKAQRFSDHAPLTMDYDYSL
jgi:exodeoxyribonuclease-3